MSLTSTIPPRQDTSVPPPVSTSWGRLRLMGALEDVLAALDDAGVEQMGRDQGLAESFEAMGSGARALLQKLDDGTG